MRITVKTADREHKLSRESVGLRFGVTNAVPATLTAVDTYAEFRLSERKTLPLRIAVVVAALVLALATGGDPPGVAALAVGFASYTALLQLVLLSRFRSDAWIYGMVGADAVFAGLAAAVLGLPGPAIAVPVAFVVQHALYLGYRGAATSAIVATLATLAGGIASGTAALSALAASAPVIAGAAALSAYVAEERFSERTGRRESERTHDANARAARILDGLRPIATALDEPGALNAFARSLITVTGFEAVAIYTRDGSSNLRMRAALASESEIEFASGAMNGAQESVNGDSAAARAASQGVALAIGAGSPASGEVPLWATRMGYASGVVAPLVTGHLTIGVVFGLDRDSAPVTSERIDQMEQFVSLAARLATAHGDGASPAARDRLSLELGAAGRGDIGNQRPVIKMDGLTLDPANDRSSVAGVPVPLSRTEFDLLYALAGSPGRVVDPGSLVKMAFGDSADSSQRTVDATMYRLRRKLSRAPAGEDLIRTVRGQGYVLVPPPPVGAPERAPESVSAD